MKIIKVMDWWRRMVFPVRRVWSAVTARFKPPKNGEGLVMLRHDIQTCGYEDVQVMWEMLRRSDLELKSSHPKRNQRPFWRLFAWSNSNRRTPAS